MSIPALNWAFTTRLKKSCDKLLLVCLANYADDQGLCWPSQARLTDDTALDRKTVIAGMRRLVDEGWIMDTGHRRGTNGRVVIRRLCLEKTQEVPRFIRDEDLDIEGPVITPIDGDSPVFPVPYFPTRSPTFPKPESHISQNEVPYLGQGTTNEPSEEPPREPPIGEATPRSEDLFGPPAAPPPKEAKPDKPADPLPEAIRIWNRICGTKLTTVTKPTEQRRRAFGARMREDFHGEIGQWETLCRRVTESDFLCGSTGFQATFDWVLKPTNLTKILEGNYANRTVKKATRLSISEVVQGFRSRASADEMLANILDVPPGDWHEH